MDSANAPEQVEAAEESLSSGDYILDTPIHDTGSNWYLVLSFFLPIPGLIAALLFKKFKHIRNFKACRKGALIGLGVIAALILLFLICLLIAVI